MKLADFLYTVVLLLLLTSIGLAQPGEVLETGSSVLDPNGDGFISISGSGFSTDGYDVDEFEIPMFGIPIFGDGEALGDNQSGPNCGITDLALDTAGYAIYAAFDVNENLIFRFRSADNANSVQSYSILIDTDQLIGADDPNATSGNPGFEIAITLIQKFGVYIYDIDGIESCPAELAYYSDDTHQQKATSAQESCETTDIYIDFYIPFSDLTNFFGITSDSNLRFVGVTNISATCALDGSISDIGGVNDEDYGGCFSCAVLDLTTNQCPSPISGLCDTCEGFPLGYTASPEINLPVLAGNNSISGTGQPDSEIYIDVYDNLGTLQDQDTTVTSQDSLWQSNAFDNPLSNGDSVVVVAYLPGYCASGSTGTDIIYIIVTPNYPPELTGSTTSINYKEGDPPVIITDDLTVTDDNINLSSATVTIVSNYEPGADLLSASPPPGISFSFSAVNGELTFTGSASLVDYDSAIRSVTFLNSASPPNLDVRVIRFVVNDGVNESQPFEKNILLFELNSDPIVSGTGSALDYSEGDGQVLLDDAIIVSDADNDDIVTATITFTSNFIAGEDTLYFSDQNGIQGRFKNQGLTLIGTTTLADFQAALRSITYENLSEEPSELTRMVTIMVNDGTDDSNEFQRDITITSINDLPLVTGTVASLIYSEGDGAVLVDDALTVSDVDNTSLSSASISISANFNVGEDILSFVDQNGITGSFAAGVLTLSGFATISDYQAALRSVTYENSSENPVTLTRTVSIQVNDGTANSTAFTRDIEITAVNDMPIISGTASSLTYTEGDGAVLLDNGLTVSDVDNLNLVSATVTISTNYQSGEDELTFTDQGGITGNYLAGILTLTGSAPLTDYQSALQSITYENISENPNTLSRTVNIIINDGTDNSDAFSRDIEITAVNDAPELAGSATALSYTEGDGAVVLDDAITVSDIDNANLASATITISANYQSGEDELAFSDQNGITGSYITGVLMLSGSATLSEYETALQSITYENSSANPSVLTRTVSILVNDGNDNSLEITRNIEITAVNNVPTVTGSASTLTYTEGDGPVVVEGAAIVSDVDNTNIESATLTITNNYQAGEDILAFSDQNGITGSFLTGVLSLSGSATLADYQAALQSVTYENTSEAPSTLTRTLGIVVNDGSDNSAEFTRDIEITAVNDIPVLTGTSTILVYNEGDGAVILDNAISVTDVDHTDMASATISISTNYQLAEDMLAFTDQNGITGSFISGVLTLSGSATLADYQAALRSVTYENTSVAPNTNNRTVEFSINDGIDPGTAITREISIIPLIEPPYISVPGIGIESSLSYTEGDGAVPLLPDFLVEDPDDVNLEGATLVFDANFVSGEDVLAFADQTSIAGTYDAATGTLLLSGTATLANYALAIRAITYENTSDNPNTVNRTLLLSVSDGDITSNDITITIEITPVNDAPAVEGTGSSLVYPESSGPIAIDDAIMVLDVDDSALENAIISIATNYKLGEDILGFADQGQIAGQFDVMTGVLTLTGTASISDYQSALRSVTYENTEDRADLSARQVEVVVSDGDLNSEVFNREILLEEVIDPVIPYQLVTPDNDGYNDSWIIDGIEQYPQSQVRLFDRWNKLVYQQESYDNISTGWVGYANQGPSGELPDGTYFYVINLGNGSELIDGFLILKRK